MSTVLKSTDSKFGLDFLEFSIGQYFQQFIFAFCRQLDNQYQIREWTIKDVLPGEPDKDYPILHEIPDTSFSCTGRSDGMRKFNDLSQ